MPDPIEVRKVPIESVSDASGLARLIDEGVIEADRVIAVIGKTEGNGGVNDYTRIIADRAYRDVLAAKGSRSMEEIKQIPIVWSGGTDGVISPHATVFATVPADQAPAERGAPAVGRVRDERADPARGHRTPGDGREGRSRRDDRHGAGRHHRPGRRPLRADQDAVADAGDHHRRQAARQGRLDRGHPRSRWTCRTRRPRSGSPWRWARSTCRARSRSTRTCRCTPRSPRARRVSSWTRRRSWCWATCGASAGATGSVTA